MSVKTVLADAFRSTLTLISPMLNTKVTYWCKFRRKLDLENPVTLNDKILWLIGTSYNDGASRFCSTCSFFTLQKRAIFSRILSSTG